MFPFFQIDAVAGSDAPVIDIEGAVADSDVVEEAEAPSYIGGFSTEFIAGRPPSHEGFLFHSPDEGVGSAPSYYVSDNWGLFLGASEMYLGQVQQQLVMAGFMGVSDIRRPGVWNDGEADAMKLVMEIANGSNRSWQRVLRDTIAAGGWNGGDGGGTGGAMKPTIRLSNTDELRSIFRQVARRETGGVFVGEDQIDALAQAYQERERAYQQQVIAGAAEAEAPPSAETFVEMSLEEVDPGAATANRFMQMTMALDALVGQ